MNSLSDGSAAPIQVSIQDWMRAACQVPSLNSYVESAVNLAWILTRHICQTMSAAQTNLKLEDHITSENILLYVERPSMVLRSAGCSHSIRDVKFRFEVETPSDVISLLNILADAGSSRSQSSRPQALCVALGKLFLDIFSQGGSRLLENPSDRAQLNNSRSALEPAGKRQAKDVSSTAARGLLLESGSPRSICDLVSDLLTAGDQSCQEHAFTSVKELFWDLTQMKVSPELFLFDRACPQRALDDTGLFSNTDKQLFGRDEERRVLMSSKDRVSEHVNSNDAASSQGRNFICEAVFLSGHPGSGKSSLLSSLEQTCNDESWFVLSCKFDKHTSPQMILVKAFNDLFGKWTQDGSDDGRDIFSSMSKSFSHICKSIFLTLDSKGFEELCDLMPNFGRLFPLLQSRRSIQDEGGISSMDKVGSESKRQVELLHVLTNALLSGEHPVLILLDDLQWSNSLQLKNLTEFITHYMSNHDVSGGSDKYCQKGLYIGGSFRSNEVSEDHFTLQFINNLKQSGKANVTTLTVGELSEADVTKFISEKLCLPWRYTKELAALVHSKTAKGNPFHVRQFLMAIIQNKMLEYSIKHRRWIWDCEVVDLQMISDDVAKLLSTTLFRNLPTTLMQTLKIVSCLGCQVEEDTIRALNSCHQVLPFIMLTELELGVQAGILEKAGPVFAFRHDILQSTVYELIPTDDRKLLHKSIGDALLNSAADDSTTHLAAVDQLNNFIKDCSPSQEECKKYAEANATAAKFAMASSSFEQAQSYIDVGLKLLDAHHWRTSYKLSLSLYEMAASLSCIRGDIPTMSNCLDQIMMHAQSFDDSLKASSLLVKLLASSLKFEEARANCLIILSNLGEEFPPDVSLPTIQGELSTLQTILSNIKNREEIEQLPRMTDRNKINAMKFMNMLCSYSIISKPLLLPLLSCRMLILTQQWGFCDDSIVGLATAGYSVFLFTEDVELATRIGKITELLVEKSPNKHALRSRLCNELLATLKMIREPWHSVVALYPDMYNSAMLAGDIENAMICRWSYCCAGFWVGSLELASVFKHLVNCIKEVTKYQQNIMIYSTMAVFHPCVRLLGKTDESLDLKSPDELNEIAEKTKSPFLTWQFFNHRMISHFWMREYIEVANLSEKQSEKHPSSQQKRILQVMRVFCEGVSYLILARDTKQAKWRNMGEKAVRTIVQLENTMSKWNFENKSKLLQAELNHLNGDLVLAEAAYKASITSAHDHKYIHEEALAYELYGVCCLENQMVEKGIKLLQLAVERYTTWGAMAKVREVQELIDLAHSSHLKRWKYGM